MLEPARGPPARPLRRKIRERQTFTRLTSHSLYANVQPVFPDEHGHGATAHLVRWVDGAPLLLIRLAEVRRDGDELGGVFEVELHDFAAAGEEQHLPLRPDELGPEGLQAYLESKTINLPAGTELPASG